MRTIAVCNSMFLNNINSSEYFTGEYMYIQKQTGEIGSFENLFGTAGEDDYGEHHRRIYIQKQTGGIGSFDHLPQKMIIENITGEYTFRNILTRAVLLNYQYHIVDKAINLSSWYSIESCFCRPGIR